MSKIINVGKVTAYADAVAGGYQGTREEWEAALAGIGQEATAALAAKEGAEAAQAAAETAQGGAETAGAAAAASAQAAASSAADAHTDALAATAAKEGAEAAQTLAGQAAAAAAGSAGTAATAQVAAEAAQTAAETAASAAATSAEGAALSEDAAAASATAAAGSAEDAQEVLDSIPEDYSELSGDVADLKSAVEQNTENISDIQEQFIKLRSVDYSTTPTYNYFITSGEWAGGGRRSCYIIPVEDADEVHITSNSNSNSTYAQLKTNRAQHNTVPDFCDGVTGVTQIPAGTSDTIDILPDCNYIYILRTTAASSSPNYTPDSTTFYTNINLNDVYEAAKNAAEEADELSEQVNAKPSQIFNIDLRDESEYGIIPNYDSESIGTSGYTPAVGWENRITIDKYIVCDDVKYRVNVSLSSLNTDVCAIGTEIMSGSPSGHATIVKFDFPNATASFLTGQNNGNISGDAITEYVYDSFAMNNLSGTEYCLEIGRKKRCVYARVYNLTTAQLCGEKILTIYETDASYGGKAGAMYDLPNFGTIAGSVTFRRASVSVPVNVFAVFVGDSITQGASLSWSDTWANKCIAYLGSGLNCGRGSGNISHALRCASDILPAAKAKYCVVTIGTNGTPTAEQLSNLISLIEKSGAIPVINRIPMNTRSGSGSTAEVNALIETLNTDSVQFDVATAINNDPSDGQNASLFGDGVHPNVAGGVAMYNQFIADMGWIKPDDVSYT